MSGLVVVASVQAVYGVLQEAEHRSVTPFPYWNLPLATLLVPRQRKFKVRHSSHSPIPTTLLLV